MSKEREVAHSGGEHALEQADSWGALRRFTPARIALGRVGDSLPTRAWLQFGLAHAQARDAVQWQLDAAALRAGVAALFGACLAAHSAAQTRAQFLQRPEAGRRLDQASRAALSQNAPAPGFDLLLVLADGLSAQALQRHALPLLQVLRMQLAGWVWAPIVLAQQARVALADEIGALWQAPLVVTLIGERPGLSSPDSLGAYLTYAPRIGCTDAQRNCVSNIRPQGLNYDAAGFKLAYLLQAARRRGCSGIALKDESEQLHLPDHRR